MTHPTDDARYRLGSVKVSTTDYRHRQAYFQPNLISTKQAIVTQGGLKRHSSFMDILSARAMFSEKSLVPRPQIC